MATTSAQKKNLRYGSIIAAFLLILFLAIGYIWLHISTQQIEYRLAAAKSKTEQLTDEQKRLHLEYSALSAPQRIEEIAIKRLQMRYPSPEQKIVMDTNRGRS